MDMSITMIGQTFNSLSYYRRRNALMTKMGAKKKLKGRSSKVIVGARTKIKCILEQLKRIKNNKEAKKLFF